MAKMAHLDTFKHERRSMTTPAKVIIIVPSSGGIFNIKSVVISKFSHDAELKTEFVNFVLNFDDFFLDFYVYFLTFR